MQRDIRSSSIFFHTFNEYSFVAEPLGNQPLKLTSHKKVDDQTAQRKTEESSERSSGALLGGYREVRLFACHCFGIVNVVGQTTDRIRWL